jgi:hypothetical protein
MLLGRSAESGNVLLIPGATLWLEAMKCPRFDTEVLDGGSLGVSDTS